MSEKIAIYDQPDYYNDLIDSIDQVQNGGRILLASMAFDHRDSTVEEVLPKLKQAAQRGASVLLLIDAYSFMFDESYSPTGPLVPPPVGKRKKHKNLFKKRAAALDSLRDAGIAVVQTNTPKHIHLPYAGRSHMKAAIIDDMWRIGGCNLADTGNLDVMVGANNDRSTATYIYNIFQQIAKTGSVRAALGDDDLVHPINDSTELLIDVGRPNQSIIFERALETIQDAEKRVTMTCQFFPSGKTAKYLAKAARQGVEVKALYNASSNKRLGGRAMQLYQTKERFARSAELFRGEIDASLPFLHSKIVASESQANIGSHNYISAGVWLGTAEIALHSTDAELAHAAEEMAIRLTEHR